MANKFIHYRQLDQMDCGPTCLRMIARHFGRHYSGQTLREKSGISREGVSLLGLSEAAETLGFKTVGVKISLEKLCNEAPLPCIIHWGQNHFVVLYAVKRNLRLSQHFLATVWGGRRSVNEPQYDDKLFDPPAQKIDRIHPYVGESPYLNQSFDRNDEDKHVTFYIADPANGLIRYDLEEFKKKWISAQTGSAKEGIALLLEPTTKFYEEDGESPKGLQLAQLMSYLWQYKKLVVQLILGMVVGTGLSVLLPLLTQSVVDIGIDTQNLSFVYVVLVAQMVLLISTSAVGFIRSWILLHISTRLNLSILSEFLSKLMRLPVSFFDVKNFGDIMQRIGDHRRIESFLTGQALSAMLSIVNLLVFGFILAWYDLPIFAVAVGASLLYGVWVALFMKQRGELDTKKFALSAKNQSQIVQLIQGMQDIKLAGVETSKRWEWERTQASLFRWTIKSLQFSQIQQAGALFINNGKNIFITFLAAKAVMEGHLTLGGMMSVQYILGQFNAPIEQLIGLLQSWQDAQMSLERLNEVHNLEDEEPKTIQTRVDWPKSSDIKIQNANYSYPGNSGVQVLTAINLTILHGKTTAIVGGSGSGKTTLLKLILRFYECQGGEITLRGYHDTDDLQTITRPFEGEIKLRSISQRAWRQQCGVVMQDGFIFSDSIARNIALHDEIINQDKLFAAAKTANIHTFIESLPMGYNTKIGTEGNGISQGQKQRVLIARAVYKNPNILLFDEATNALDANNEGTIIKNLASFFAGKTVVVVAHRLSTVKHADQIIVMDKGAIVEQGTHQQLLEIRGKYFELVSNQLELSR